MLIEQQMNAQDWKQYYNNNHPNNKQDHNYNHMIYVIAPKQHDRHCKIGKATNMFQRLRALQQGNHNVLFSYLVWMPPKEFIHNIDQIENIVHSHFNDQNLIKKTNQSSGHTEWFMINPETACDFIKNLIQNPKEYQPNTFFNFFKEAA